MADDLDRAGQDSGGPAGRAGVIQAGREFLQDWESRCPDISPPESIRARLETGRGPAGHGREIATRIAQNVIGKMQNAKRKTQNL